MTSNKTDAPEVVIMSSVHSADDIRINLKEARSLARSGIRVALAAPGLSQLPPTERLQIITTARHKSRSIRMFRGTYDIFAAALRSGAKVCHFHDPELIPYGILLKLLGRKVIYDVHEDVPKQILAKDWIPRYLRKPIANCAQIAETVASSIFDGIVAATPSIARKFPARKTFTIQNFPLQSEIMVSEPHEGLKVKSLVYVGGISRTRGLFTMLEAVRLINGTQTVALHLAGRFTPPTLEEEAQKHPGWKHVVWHGWLDRSSTIRILRSARVGLLLLDATPNHTESLPIKLFEYMAAGIPVIASDFPLWESIIKHAGCGLLVDPKDSVAISNAMLWILKNPQKSDEMGRRGLQAVQDCYSWSSEEQKLLSLYAKLLS